MKRRNFLTVAGVSSVAAMASAASFPSPALAQNVRRLRMVTSWPPRLPGVAASAERLAAKIREASDGTLDIQVYAAGELMSAFEVFDAVSRGEVDIYNSAESYWRDRSEAFSFFNSVPFGMTPSQFNSWIYHGGGQELWDALAAQYNLKPHLSANTGTQWGGWFRREVESVEDLQGMRIRISGLGSDVLRRLGAEVVQLPADKILNALEEGSIDAAEWAGPWNDLAFGFHRFARNYYWPGFHAPSSGEATSFNLDVWHSLTPSQQRVVEAVCAAENEASHGVFLENDALALNSLQRDYGVKLREFSDSLFSAFREKSTEVLQEIVEQDVFVAQVYASYSAAQAATGESLRYGQFGYLAKIGIV